MPILNAPTEILDEDFKNEEVLTDDEKDRAIRTEVNLNLIQENKMLVFKMTQPSGSYPVIGPDDYFGSFIGVPEKKDLILTVKLSNAWRWHFDERALFPKYKIHHHFFHHEEVMGDKKTLILHLKSTDKTAQSGVHNRQAFGFRIAMEQPDAKYPLVVVIDPDVKNPPPGDPVALEPDTWLSILPQP